MWRPAPGSDAELFVNFAGCALGCLVAMLAFGAAGALVLWMFKVVLW